MCRGLRALPSGRWPLDMGYLCGFLPPFRRFMAPFCILLARAATFPPLVGLVARFFVAFFVRLAVRSFILAVAYLWCFFAGFGCFFVFLLGPHTLPL